MYFLDLLICVCPNLQRSVLHSCLVVLLCKRVRTACSQEGENINDTGIYFSWCGMKFHSMEITTALYQNKTSGNTS